MFFKKEQTNGSSLRSDMKATSPQVIEMKEMTDPTTLYKVGGAEVAQCEHSERTPVALTLL